MSYRAGENYQKNDRRRDGWNGRKLTLPLLIAAVAGLGVVPAQAGALTGPEVTALITERLAAENLQANPTISANRIFPECAGKVEVLPMFGGWHTVSVACNKPKGWRFAIRANLKNVQRVRVPVRRNRATVDTTSPAGLITTRGNNASKVVVGSVKVLALARSVTKGDVITAADLVIVEVPERNAHGAFLADVDIVGRRLKSSLTAGQPVRARHLQPDILVAKDTEVIIVGRAGAVSVDVLGVALEDGQFGEWIEVQNASSGHSIFAKVISEKKVAVIAKKG